MILSNQDISAKLSSVNESLTDLLKNQRNQIIKTTEPYKCYSKPIPNNHSFILYHQTDCIIEKLKQQAISFDCLNRISEKLYYFYSYKNKNNNNLVTKIVVDDLLNNWKDYIDNGNYFLTWKLFWKIDSEFIKIDDTYSIPEQVTSMAKGISRTILSSWEIGIAISQHETIKCLDLLTQNHALTESGFDRIEIGKMLGNSSSNPYFPTIKIHYNSCLDKETIFQTCFKCTSLLEDYGICKGELKTFYGMKYRNYLRVQNGFEALKHILYKLKIIDKLYYSAHNYAFIK